MHHIGDTFPYEGTTYTWVDWTSESIVVESAKDEQLFLIPKTTKSEMQSYRAAALAPQ